MFVDEENRIYKDEYIYSRYWHGYNILLRPLLIFFDYFEIEVLCGILFIIMFIIFEITIYKKVGKFLAFAMMFSLFSISYHTLWLSIALVPTIIIMMISSILIINNEKIKDFNLFFFIVGSITCYFCWMNFEFITLGIPLVFYYLKKDGNIKEFFKFTIMWGLGYALTWISKWIITDLFYNVGAINDAIIQIFYRASDNLLKKGKVTAASTICLNLMYITIPLFIEGVILYFDYLKNRYRINGKIKDIIKYVLIALIPFGVCVVFKNHSYLHARSFVYRTFIILVFDIFVIYYKVFKENKNEKFEKDISV